MKRPLVSLFVVFLVGLITGCAYFPKKDEPPPLPPIEETKPPLKLKGEYFKAFPWPDLAKPRKDGNDPDTRTYTVREGDTFQTIAENEMGDPAMGPELARYNDASDTSRPPVGEKIVIPNPIIGMRSQLEVKKKGEKQFAPEPFETELSKGDEYKLGFESNVNGYCYVFRRGVKGLEMLYPAPIKKGKRNKKPAPLPPRDTGKISVHEPILIPSGPKGFAYDPKSPGDQVFVFLCLRTIPELEDLKDKQKLRVQDVEEVMRRVNEGGIVTEGATRVLRISDPADILGFTVNLSG